MNERVHIQYSEEHNELRNLTRDFVNEFLLSEDSSLDVDGFVDRVVEIAQRSGKEGKEATEFILRLLNDDMYDVIEYNNGLSRHSKSPTDWHYSKLGYKLRLSKDGKVILQYEDASRNLQYLELPKDELHYHAHLLRQRVQERLRSKQVENMHLLDQRVSRSVHRTHGDWILRRNKYYPAQEALSRLYKLPDVPPYIFLPDRRSHAKYTDRAHDDRFRSLEKHRDFISLKQVLTTKAISASEALSVYRDFLLACDFLIKHGFRMSDLDISNIGIDPASGQGFAFDFDGLRESYDDTGYCSKITHVPPERISEKYPFRIDSIDFYGEHFYPIETKEGPFTVAEMLYELGTSLFSIGKELEDKMPQDVKDALFQLASEMRSQLPEKRPPLHGVLRDIRDIIRRLDPAYDCTDPKPPVAVTSQIPTLGKHTIPQFGGIPHRHEEQKWPIATTPPNGNTLKGY